MKFRHLVMPKRSGANLIVQVCVCNNTLLIRVEKCPRQIWLEGREPKTMKQYPAKTLWNTNNNDSIVSGTWRKSPIILPKITKVKIAWNLYDVVFKSQKLRKELEESQQKLSDVKAKLQSAESKNGWFERRLTEAEVFPSFFFLFWRPFCPLVLLYKMATWRMRFSFLLFHY